MSYRNWCCYNNQFVCFVLQPFIQPTETQSFIILLVCFYFTACLFFPCTYFIFSNQEAMCVLFCLKHIFGASYYCLMCKTKTNCKPHSRLFTSFFCDFMYLALILVALVQSCDVFMSWDEFLK